MLSLSKDPIFFSVVDEYSPVSDTRFYSQLTTWNFQTRQNNLLTEGTHYFYIFAGELTVSCESGEFQAGAGMYGSIPGPCQLTPLGEGLVISHSKQMGFFLLGGPIEKKGRLKYIDGCTDSLLIPPILVGDPCLNLLHIPARTQQTAHTHPSVRMGMIVAGAGVCRTPQRSFKLKAGLCFVLPAECEHSFHTEHSDLRVIAYHPDSDSGPTHQNHPMVNRTYVNGVSAGKIDRLLTP